MRNSRAIAPAFATQMITEDAISEFLYVVNSVLAGSAI